MTDEININNKIEIIVCGIITILLAIDGLTGRWLPNVVEHLGAGFLIPFWFFKIMNCLSKKKFVLLKIIVAMILYLIVLIAWEKNINSDFIFGIIGLGLFLIFIIQKTLRESKVKRKELTK